MAALVRLTGHPDAKTEQAAVSANAQKWMIGAATRWLRDRHAVRRILGPINFDVWHGYRFMTRGFAEQRFLGEPYNPPYYPELFERCGFVPRQRWNSYEAPPAAYAEYEQLAREKQPVLRDLGYRFVARLRKDPDLKTLRRDPRFLRLLRRFEFLV